MRASSSVELGSPVRHGFQTTVLCGSSGRIRTYNPSVNSRTAYSRLALQTQDLRARRADFPGNWGDSVGTLAGRNVKDRQADSWWDRITSECAAPSDRIHASGVDDDASSLHLYHLRASACSILFSTGFGATCAASACGGRRHCPVNWDAVWGVAANGWEVPRSGRPIPFSPSIRYVQLVAHFGCVGRIGRRASPAWLCLGQGRERC